MMNLAFLFLLLLSSGLNAVNIPWDSLLTLLNKNELTYLELDSFLERNNNLKAKKKTISAIAEFRRVELGELIQTVYRIKKIQSKRKWEYYSLSYLLLDKKVVYIRLKRRNSRTSIIQKRMEAFDEYLNKHFDELNIEVDQNHKYFFPSDQIVVGFGCGFGGEPRPQFNEMVELVRNRNKSEILNWCNSLSPEIRYYGGIGLGALKELNTKLTKNESLILEAISKEKTNIFTCSGCTGWGEKYPLEMMFQGGSTIILNNL